MIFNSIKKNKKLQKGGWDVLSLVPPFKYTISNERRLFVNTIYPYAEYFLNCIDRINFDSYSFNGKCEYTAYTPIQEDTYEDIPGTINHQFTYNIIPHDNISITEYKLDCVNTSKPFFHFMGGTVYEILNKKYSNINLHDYCDATGDIDMVLQIPTLTDHTKDYPNLMRFGVHFLNRENKINTLYNHFITWTFQRLFDCISSMASLIDKMNFVSFDIDEYQEKIPNEHKTTDLGYMINRVGNLIIIGFLTDGKEMYKIQVVGKIQGTREDLIRGSVKGLDRLTQYDNQESFSVIDHLMEFVILLPSLDDSPSIAETFKNPKIDNITIGKKNYNIQTIEKLINGNINAYRARQQFYEEKEEISIHKSINHVGRLLYLFELLYRNENSFDIQNINLNLFSYFRTFRDKQKLEREIEYLKYYKIIDNTFQKIKIQTKFLLYAYIKLIKKNQYSYKIAQNTTFSLPTTPQQEVLIHDLFVNKLFDNDTRDLTMELISENEITQINGGKKTRKKRINKRTYKNTNKRNNKRRHNSKKKKRLIRRKTYKRK
jgi:hypothetical protein